MFKNIYKNDAMKRADHEAVRKRAGWYFYTHQLVEVTGKDAAAYLDYIYPKKISSLADGRARYTPMLNEQGVIRDDAVVFRMEENRFWISTLYARRVIAWLEAHKGDREAAFEDITKKWAMYSVQGPVSKELLSALVAESIEDQKFFEIRDNRIGDIPVKINRGGFTGEKWGYEIYISPEYRGELEKKLEEAGRKLDARHVTEFQVMVLTLPTEKGYYLMCDLEQSTPLEIPGFSKGIDYEKDFIGKEALLAAKDEPPKYWLFGFTVDDEEANIASRDKTGEGAEVILPDGEHVGYVTKFTYGFTAEKSIGYARLEADRVKVGDTVILNDRTYPTKAVLTETVFV